jgi:integrase
VSNYLHEIQTGTGLQVLRWTKGSSQREKMKGTQVQRKNGTRAGSVRDWHCLRTTFCTHCLQAGVQEALLRKITGHGTLDLVLKHYFQPDVEGLHAGFASVVKAWG